MLSGVEASAVVPESLVLLLAADVDADAALVGGSDGAAPEEVAVTGGGEADEPGAGQVMTLSG